EAKSPVVLLIDEATEIRSLAYFKGLREVHEPFLARLCRRPRGTVLATSFPSLAARLWPDLEAWPVPRLAAEAIAPLRAARGVPLPVIEFLTLSAGLPRYARILFQSLPEGAAVLEGWRSAMEPGGSLEEACRQTYETLLLRSRGYGMSKAVLAEVARRP